MKLRLHGIRKNTLLLFFNMVLVLVTALLVLSNIRTRNELEESKRGFYSKSTVEFTSGGSSWEELLGVLQEEGWRDGILFREGLELEADTRGVFFKGDFKRLPLRSGRYLTEAEVSGTERKAMIGQRFEKDTYEENGKQCIEILGEPFEVVGVLGSAQPTRMDSMKWMPLGTAAELVGMEGSYILDGRTEEAIERNADLLAPVLEREVTIVTGFAEDAGGEDPGYSEKNRNVVEKIYLGIVFSFVLTLVLAGNSWARSRTQRIQVEKMLGFSGGRILLSVLGGYFRTALLALAAAGLLTGALTLGKQITAVGWKEICLTVGCVILGELLVVAAGLSLRIGSRKIRLKRG